MISIIGLGLLTLGTLVFPGCAKKEEPKKTTGDQKGLDSEEGKPNVLLITLDTVRADHFGMYGYKAPERQENSFSTTPNLDELVESRGGVVFQHAIAVSSYTQPTHASILTGLYPQTHGVRTNKFGKGTEKFRYLTDSNLTMAEILKSEGYCTGAVIAGDPLTSEFNFDQGFDVFEDKIPRFPNNIQQAEKFAKQVTLETLQILEKFAEQEEAPFFVWAHYYDAHGNYWPPSWAQETCRYLRHEGFDHLKAPFGRRDEYYDSEIGYMDFHLGKLFEGMEKMNILKNTMIVVIGDHGQSLDEKGPYDHGTYGHGWDHKLYNATQEVPFLFLPPVEGKLQVEGVKYIENRVRQIDVLPTVLDYLRINSPKDIQGVSLKEIIEEENSENSTAFAECPFEVGEYTTRNLIYPQGKKENKSADNTNFVSAVYVTIDGINWKLTDHGTPEGNGLELYNLDADPGELNNLALRKEYDGIIQQLSALIQNWRSTTPKTISPEVEMSPGLKERLKSLGYIN